MKSEKSFNRNHIRAVIVLIVVITAFIYLFMFDFSKRVDYQMQKMTLEHLQDVNNESLTAVETELDRVLEEVRLTADFLSVTPELSADSKRKLYGQLKEKCGFANIRLISGDGSFYAADGERLPDSAGGYVEKVLRGESGMTDVFLSGVTGEEVFAVYAPVMKGGTAEGGIAGIMIVDQLVDMVATTGFNSGSYTYVLKSDGTVIMQTNHEDSLYQGREYFRFLREQTDMGAEAVADFQERMERHEKGEFVLRAGREKRIACYAPTKFNDWYVLTVVPYAISNRYRERINVTAMFLIVKIVLVFLLQSALVIVWSLKTRKIILNSREELVLEKKKLELALQHATGVTFEYNPKADRFTFITPPIVKGCSFPAVMQEITVNAAVRGLVASEFMTKWRETFLTAAKGQEPEPLEFPGGAAFPEDTYFRLTITPVRDGRGGVIEAIGTLEDITEEKEIRRRFAQEEQYRAALLSEAVAMWSVDLVKQRVMACTIKGNDWLKDQKDFLYSGSFIRSMCRYVHPDDQKRMMDTVQTNTMLAAYYTGKREIKELFRAAYSGADAYKWMTFNISLLTEPESGNPVAFAYARDVDEETRRRMELTYSSERDPLTGLYNRRNIAERVSVALKEGKCLSCLMMMDLDGFKEINDQFGHQEGDLVLRKMAAILSGAFRSDDLVARFGGDEFIVFLNRLPDRECAYARAEQVRREVYAIKGSGEEGVVSISIGLAFGPDDGNNFALLYKHADEALYLAKGRGKNQIAAYGEEEKIRCLERPD